MRSHKTTVPSMLSIRRSATNLTLPIFFSFACASVCHASVATSFALDGFVGAEVAAFAHLPEGSSSFSTPSGNFLLGNIPTGATIARAYLYGHSYFSNPIPIAKFGGTSLGTTSSIFSDSNKFFVYRWDVTSLITGNGSYSVSVGELNGNRGLALTVAFSDPSLPFGRVMIKDGAEDITPGVIGNPENPPVGDSASTTFDAAHAGRGNLWLHTVHSNGGEETGEVIFFNDTPVGGPLDGNLGPYADLLRMPVATVAGQNTMTIDVPYDRMGWDLAVLTTSPIPEPGTMLLLGLGLIVMVGVQLNRKSLLGVLKG